ncbi:DUF2087 domain-containing protein [Streptomyces sp. NPDC017979]|uniref:DUF2087 domain-containing protein n=1 Tax=Streptomyces sp. NPDC017979 TaxID=3365024 RepID=UPI00379E3232
MDETPRRRDVQDLFSGGRLVTMPRKAARREQLLTHLAETLFEADAEYGEPEVNERLSAVYDDYALLRRDLVEAGKLRRHRDGCTYWRAA